MINKLITLLLSGLLAACAATPPTQFYVLEAQNSPSVSSSTMEKKPLIGIGPLSLPALVDRQQIVTRQENNAIDFAEFHQWASPLQDNVLAVLSKNIAIQQPDSIIREYPWGAYGQVDYRVIIDISRFDAKLGKSVNLDASWSIMNEKNHTIISNGQTKIQQPLNDASYQTAVTAFNKLLNDFSQQLSVALHQVQQNVKTKSVL